MYSVKSISRLCFNALKVFLSILQDCFSMVNISWYGGASVHAPSWPINDANISMQPFTVSDLRDNPSGFGSILERYFLGSTGKRTSISLTVSSFCPPCSFTLCWPVQTCIHFWVCTQCKTGPGLIPQRPTVHRERNTIRMLSFAWWKITKQWTWTCVFS